MCICSAVGKTRISVLGAPATDGQAVSSVGGVTWGRGPHPVVGRPWPSKGPSFPLLPQKEERGWCGPRAWKSAVRGSQARAELRSKSLAGWITAKAYRVWGLPGCWPLSFSCCCCWVRLHVDGGLTEQASERARQKTKLARCFKCNKKFSRSMETVTGKPGKRYPREGASELLMAEKQAVFSLFLFLTLKMSNMASWSLQIGLVRNTLEGSGEKEVRESLDLFQLVVLENLDVRFLKAASELFCRFVCFFPEIEVPESGEK